MVIRSRLGPQGPQRLPAQKWSVNFENVWLFTGLGNGRFVTGGGLGGEVTRTRTIFRWWPNDLRQDIG